MNKIEELSSEEITRRLTYVGFVLIAFELVKSLIISPIKLFYHNTTFTGSSLFHSYEQDVLSRSKKEFEARLLYLRDFMKAIDDEDFNTIQELREHRNILAHNIVTELESLNLENYSKLLERVDKARHVIYGEVCCAQTWPSSALYFSQSQRIISWAT